MTADTTYSVSRSVSSIGFALLLSTAPYSANSGTSASCLAYADCVSLAVGAAASPAPDAPDDMAAEARSSLREPASG